MQLARTAATLKGQFLPVLFCRGERGGERERERESWQQQMGPHDIPWTAKCWIAI